MARSVIRKPSLKKSISARTKGKVTRAVKKVTIPEYGVKETGVIKNTKKAVYKSTSISVFDILKSIFK